MAYLFCMSKTFVLTAGIGILSPMYGRHHAGSAIFMPRLCKNPGLPQTPCIAYPGCTDRSAYGILAVCTPQQGEETWRQLASSG
jgi:hypothetical protein